MGKLKEIILALLFGDTIDNKVDYSTLAAKVSYQKSKLNQLYKETNDRISLLKNNAQLTSEKDELYEINYQIIRLQSQLELLDQQLLDVERLSEKINNAMLEDKIHASTIESYEIELELTKFQ